MRTSLSIPLLFGISALALIAACSGGAQEPVTDDDGTGASGGGGSGGCVPALETCDGVDNNCDGEIDEGCLCSAGDTQPCFSGDVTLVGIGACAEGAQTCDESGSWSACEGEVLPTQEICDGADNDCNSATDEGFGSITCGLGICQVTVEECVGGEPQACIPGPADAAESCNGLDDTCDGTIDEGCDCIDGQTQSCYSGSMGTQGVGLCQSGMQTCQDGAWGACVGEVTPVAEICDGLDNDCDGNPDNGNPDSGGMCNTGQMGVCMAGIENCQNGGLVCTQIMMASPEICDLLDNDCNGLPDDGDPGGGGDCTIGGQMGICADGTLHCNNGMIECTADFPNAPISELCNGLDDDCDGMPDDGNPEGGGSCNTGLMGECAVGTLNCMNAVLTCQQTNMSMPETCNGLDDNCDGMTDEGNPGGGGACNTGLPGVCAAGTMQCSNGSLSCQQNTMAGAEICGNMIDEDCDGVADNGCTGCGDGVLVAGEACDDNNNTNGDGCSSSCVIENGYCCTGQPSNCIGSPVALTFSSINLAIPDGSYDGSQGSMGCVNLNMDICAGTITDLDVAIGLDHTWAGDVTARLISPMNTASTLFHRPGNPATTSGDSSNFAATSLLLFNDAFSIDPETMGSTLSTTQVICQDDGICNYAANPDGDVGTNLADFNGQSLGGTWTICLGDSAGLDTGTLQTVELLPSFN